MFGNKKDGVGAAATGNATNIDTLIGASCTITGDITTKSSIKIDGSIKGNVTAEGTIVVAERGNIKGDVKCKELVVFGSIEGTLTTNSLHLQPTSSIIGEINTQSLNVEVGAVYQGAVNMKKSGSTSSNTNSTINDKSEKIKL